MGVAACLLLEYGVSTAAVAVGWSQYLNKLLDNLFGFEIPQALSAAPFDEDPGVLNLPAVILIVLCALLLIRGASESAAVNTVMVVIKLSVLVMFIVIGFTAFDSGNLQRTSRRSASPESALRRGPSSSPSSAWTRCPPPARRSRTRNEPCRGR